jgi:transcriptional regulator with XRE-family HTH domain
MALSTIYQLPDPGGRLTVAIGRELRRRRLEAALSQARVAAPFTRALVCAVERGRTMPSIPALACFLEHLDVDLAEFFVGVQSEMTREYTASDGDQDETTRRRR